MTHFSARNVQVLFVLSFAFASRGLAADPSMEPCNSLWSQRPNLEQVEKASLCFAEFAESLAGEPAPEALALRRVALEHELDAHFYIVHRSPRTELERKHIALGLEAVEFLLMDYPETGSGYYWRASFVTKDAERKDRGRTIPNTMMAALPKIRKDLTTAMEKDPSYHRYGAYRVYGLMQVMAPKFPAGGNPVEGEAYLRKAYDSDWEDAKKPELKVFPFSVNAIFLAQGLLKVGKTEEARAVLQRLVEDDPSVYGELKRPDTLEDQALARSMLDSLGL
jgi:hypothetical protein